MTGPVSIITGIDAAASGKAKSQQGSNRTLNRTSVELIILLAVSLCFWLPSFIVQPALPLYILKMGAREVELGLILSTSSIVILLTKMPFGILSDKMGRWKTVGLSILLYSLTNFLYLMVPNTLWLYPVMVSGAVASSLFGPASMSISSNLAQEGRRGRTIGTYMTAAGIAMMFGPAINSLLLGYGGYSSIFLIASSIGLVGFSICIVGLLKHLIGAVAFVPEDRSPMKRNGNAFLELKRLLASRPIVAISIARMSFSITDAIFSMLFPIYIVHYLSMSPSMVGLLLSLFGVANVLVRWPSGLFCDLLGESKMVIIGYTATAICFLFFSEISLLGLIALLFILGLAHGGRVVAELAFVVDHSSSAAAMSYLSTVVDLGVALGQILAGLLMATMPMPWVFRISAATIVVGVTPFALLSVRGFGLYKGDRGGNAKTLPSPARSEHTTEVIESYRPEFLV